MATSNKETHYTILEVAQSATEEEIRSAYKKMALKWHPDKNADNIEAATDMFQRVANSYEVLSEPSTRREYDAVLLGGHTSSSAGGYSQQKRDRNEAYQRAQDIFNHFFPGGFSFTTNSSGGISVRCSVKCSISSTTTSSSNGVHTTVTTTTNIDESGREVTRKETTIRKIDGTTSVTVEKTGGSKQQGKAVKSAKATKHTSSTTNSSSSIPVVTISDESLASLVRDGTLKAKYTTKELQVMLANRQLKMCGKKDELIERLENYIKEVNKKQEPALSPEQRQQQQLRAAQEAQRQAQQERRGYGL